MKCQYDGMRAKMLRWALVAIILVKRTGEGVVKATVLHAVQPDVQVCLQSFISRIRLQLGNK